MSWARSGGSMGLALPAEALDILAEAIDDDQCRIVGHETAFDVFVSVVNSENPSAWIKAWCDKYDKGLVHDTAIRQKLIDLAWGRYRWHRHSNGHATRVNYDLATTSQRNGGPRLNKQDVWRTQYALLDGVPLSDWPAEAREYSQLDPIATIWSYENQADWRENTSIPQIWAGYQTYPIDSEPDPLANEYDQTWDALWLKAMSGHGIRTDYAAIKQYEARARAAYGDLCVETHSYGLTRREYWRDLPKLREQQHYLKGNAPWREIKAAMDQDDPSAWSEWQELTAAGLVKMRYKCNTKATQSLMLEVCELKGLAVPRTDGLEKAQRTRDPEWHEFVAIDSDACRVSEDERLVSYADLVHQRKIIGADVPQLMLGIERPIHTHFETLLETGRISSSAPNLTNRARGVDAHPGDRECFVPREGFVFIDYDFAQLEMYCIAQVCRWVLGYSTLGDALLQGLDPHIDFAAAQLGLTYEEAEAWPVKQLKPYRQAAKGYNFGRWGGLGTTTFVSYAAKAYGVVKTKEQWDEIFAIGDAKWREAKHYFNFINSLDDGTGRYNIAQCSSNRLRADCSYCSASNSEYQGLGADVAKRAGRYLFRACYVKGVDPLLYVARPALFIHDQFMVEILEARAAAAAPRVEYWCGKAAREVLPDYGHKMAEKSTAILARRYSKQAEKATNDNGDLIAWEDERLFTEAS